MRSEAYWEWLLARGACDRIYVAATGPEPGDLAKLLDSIVGYAFVRQGRLVEVVADARRPDVARHLAARVCCRCQRARRLARALRRSARSPAARAASRDAGGRLVSQQQLDGEVFMAKLLDPLALLRLIAGSLHQRAKAAGLARPARLGSNCVAVRAAA